MERLAFALRNEIADPGARTLRRIIIVNAIVLAIGVALGAAAPTRAAPTPVAGGPVSAEGAVDRTLEVGARPQPGRRF